MASFASLDLNGSNPSLDGPGARAALFLGVVLLLVAAFPARADLGQDVCAAVIDEAEASEQAPLLLFDAAGVGYLITRRTDTPSGDEFINVRRSEDGGSTWERWSFAGPYEIEGQIDACIVPGSTEQLCCVYATPNGIYRLVTDLDEEEASWDRLTVFSSFGSLGSPRVAAFQDADDPWARVGIAFTYQVFPGSLPTYLMYASSVDAADQFDFPVIVTAFDSDNVEVDVAYDAEDVVHIVTATQVTGLMFTLYLHGIEDGQTVSDWSPPYALFAFPGEPGPVAITALPDSGAIWATSGPASAEVVDLFHCSNAGDATDSHFFGPFTAERTFFGRSHPTLASGPDGPVLGLVVREAGEPAWYEVRLGESGWDARTPLVPLGAEGRGIAVAVDPTHADQFAVAGLMPTLEGSDMALWFDASWRTEPGYGKPEFEPGVLVGGSITSAPAIFDLDGDLEREVIVTVDEPHRLRRFDLESASMSTIATLGPTGPCSAPVVADLDRDGAPEIFVGATDGTLRAFRVNGSAYPGFAKNLGTASPVWLSAFDVRDTEALELIATSAARVSVYDAVGALAPGFPYFAPPAAGSIVGRVTPGDLDDDGVVELLCAYEHGVIILDAAGNVESVWFTTGAAISAGVSLGQLDDDPPYEVAVPRADGTVEILNHDGTTLDPAFPFDTGSGLPVGPVALGGLISEEGRDLFFVSGEIAYTVHTPIPGLFGSYATGPQSGLPEPIVAGLGDEVTSTSIALGDDEGNTHVFLGSIAQDGWPRSMHEPIVHAAAAGDLDDDGLTELVVPAGSRLWVLDMGVTAEGGTLVWPMAGANAQRNGCRDCDANPTSGVNGAETADGTADSSTRLRVSPNPMTHAAVFSFDLPLHGEVSAVELFDVRGRHVRTLAIAPEARARGAVRWDGQDDAGRATPAGVYWARLAGSAEVRPVRVVRVEP